MKIIDSFMDYVLVYLISRAPSSLFLFHFSRSQLHLVRIYNGQVSNRKSESKKQRRN